MKEYFFDCEVAEAEPLPSIIRMVLQYLFQMIGSISPDRKYIQERLNTFFGYESKLHYTLFRVNVWTAKPLVEKYGEDKVIVTILTDRAERNFSIALHKEDYKNGFY